MSHRTDHRQVREACRHCLILEIFPNIGLCISLPLPGSKHFEERGSFHSESFVVSKNKNNPETTIFITVKYFTILLINIHLNMLFF